MKLKTELNIADPDAFYENLIGLHADREDSQSLALNARLAQLLSELVGDQEALQEADHIAAAGQTASGTPEYNTKLILLLANHIGDPGKLADAFRQAQTH
jgi:hypothetical protein